MYTLKRAHNKNLPLLEKWKIQTILEYASDLPVEELSKLQFCEMK